MKVDFWGTRGSIPSPGPETIRYGGNTSCVGVTLSDGSLVVLDAGTGIRGLGMALAAPVAHRGPTLGYRIDDGGSSLAYIPDHEPALGADLEALEPGWISGFSLAEDADLQIHDGQYADEEYPDHLGWGHSALSHSLPSRGGPGRGARSSSTTIRSTPTIGSTPTLRARRRSGRRAEARPARSSRRRRARATRSTAPPGNSPPCP